MPQFLDGLHELLDGRIVEKTMPGDEHGWIARRLMREIDRFDPNEEIGMLWASTSFKIKQGWDPIPDLGFVIKSKVPKGRAEKSVNAIPDLVVEVVSPTDLINNERKARFADKKRGYFEANVSLCWFIYPKKQIVEVYHASLEEPVKVLGIEDILDGEDIIPGFKFPVAKLFE